MGKIRNADKILHKISSNSRKIKKIASNTQMDDKTPHAHGVTSNMIRNRTTNYCVHCRKMFSSAKALQDHNIMAHLIRQAGNKRIPNTQYCNVCEKNFSSFLAMSNHYKSIHLKIKENHHCNVCPKKFSSGKALDFHMKFLHPVRKNEKVEGNKEITKKENSDDSTKIKGKSMTGFEHEKQFDIIHIIFRCEKCVFSTSNDGEMIEHYESEHARLQIDPTTFHTV